MLTHVLEGVFLPCMRARASSVAKFVKALCRRGVRRSSMNSSAWGGAMIRKVGVK